MFEGGLSVSKGPPKKIGKIGVRRVKHVNIVKFSFRRFWEALEDFKKQLEACRNNLHLFSPESDLAVPTDDQKTRLLTTEKYRLSTCERKPLVSYSGSSPTVITDSSQG